MKRILALTIALAAPLVARSASAKSYGEGGTVEVSGGVSFANTTDKTTIGDGTASRNETHAVFQPQVGYYLLPGLEVFGLGSLDLSLSKGEDATTRGSLGAGGGYYFRLRENGLRLGPDVSLEYLSQQGGLVNSATGTRILAGGTLKVPLGDSRGAAIQLGVHYELLTRHFSYPANTVKSTGVVPTIGFGAFF